MNNRQQEAFKTRKDAAELATNRPHPDHVNNGDEQKFRHNVDTAKDHAGLNVENRPSFMMSFTKGLPHNEKTGLVNDPTHFQYFVRGIDSGNSRDFIDTPLGPENGTAGWKSDKAKDNDAGIRGWESQGAGLVFELQGPDAQAVTMPPAPRLGDDELTAEMAEVYAQALLRDIPFNALSAGVTRAGNNNTNTAAKLRRLFADKADVDKVKDLTDKLGNLNWFNGTSLNLNEIERIRRRTMRLNPATAFRGITPGDDIGPYLSQFLLAGNRGINGVNVQHSPKDGLITYGAMTILQQVRTAAQKDYMTTWDEWLDVQNGADLRGREEYESRPIDRPIYTPRDLATYVHYDALYQAYLNACLILLNMGVPFDLGLPFQEADSIDHQQGFAHFGGPHILSLVTEVATRALKAVRFQKFNVHRRCRPEVLAARVYKEQDLKDMAPELTKMKNELNSIGLLQEVRNHNGTANNPGTELLPMAFCEGSPMHPAYGAGHATVAGACITILKAFFDHEHHLNIVPVNEIPGTPKASSNYGYVTVFDGTYKLEVVPVYDADGNPAQLTVEGELNKLASNISIGRNWAGVHYFTDYYESLLMGEQIALEILREQKLTFMENFSMTVPLFNGDTVRI